ncbi:serine/threonine protein kinase [Paenibacillus tarimensis]
MEHEQEQAWENGMVIGGRYRITALIGTGGMGAVYAADDLRLPGKRWAVKVSRILRANGDNLLEEARLLMKLNHPRLPAIADYFPLDRSHPEHSILIMELIEGCTLQKLTVNREATLEFQDVVHIAVQLCETLIYLHRQHPPVIHRDLKPANVMVLPGGDIKLIDLGIARQYKEGQSEDTLWLGTPGFAAPEQSGGRQSDPRADQYGLGALLYHMLSGGDYYTNGSPIRPERLTGMPASFAAVMEKLLAPDPRHRYKCAADALKALMRYHTGAKPAVSLKERQHSYGSVREPTTITVSSLGAGAGATFLTLTIGRLLAQKGIRCTAIEHPMLPPEWVSLLDAGGEAMMSEEVDDPIRRKYHVWREGTVTWCGLHPAAGAMQYHEDWLPLLSRKFPAEVVLYDLSSYWHTAQCESLLSEADICLFAADPWPSRWPAPALKGYADLIRSRTETDPGKKTYWIANKDLSFRQRKEWLSMIPGSRLAAVPQLPPEEWIDWLWQGRWATDCKPWRDLINERLRPLWSII